MTILDISLKPGVDRRRERQTFLVGGRMNGYLYRPESDGMLGGGGDEEALMQVICGGGGGGGQK